MVYKEKKNPLTGKGERHKASAQTTLSSHSKIGGDPIFVIHEHDATKLHWDLRLEMDGVLKSWALPKEPPTELGIKRLAIQVEDHPLAYATFAGTIPEGQYGAGTVKIWDTGDLFIESRKSEKIVFELNGKKMKGRFVIFKTKFGKDTWLFTKLKVKINET